MAHPFYRIIVKPDDDGFGYILFNDASGAQCGDRLRKGETPLPWPFPKNSEWWKYDERKDADKAALKLQAYLDGKPAGSKASSETKKAKTRKGRTD